MTQILQALFLTMLEISLASSVVIAILLILSPIIGKRYKSGLRYFLWLALAVRLLIPFNAPWEHALRLNLFASPYASETEAAQFIPNTQAGLATEIPQTVPQILQLNKPSSQSRLPMKPVQAMAIIWVAGASLFLLYHIGSYLHACRRLNRWCVPVKTPEIIDAFSQIKQDLRIGGDIGLYFSAKASSPLLVGFLRPRIILPEREISQEQLEFMLRHELIHYCRRDLWYKLLILLANAAHWFNPLVYIMDIQSNLDVELACDADVLEGYGRDERKAYGYAILSVMEQSRSCRTPLTTRFCGGKKQMLERFNDITTGENKKRGFAVFLIILAIIALSGCMVKATAQSEAQQTAQPIPELEVADIPPASSESEESAESEDFEPDGSEYENIYMGGKMLWPLPDVYAVSSSFGPRFDGEDYHTGIDITGSDIYGKPVVAANAGTVLATNSEYTAGVGYGMYVIIDHGSNIATLYGQLSDISVNAGDFVARGQEIGAVGSTGFSTGPHLHFEVRESGKAVDPTPYISSPGFIWPTTGGYISAGVGAYPGHTGLDIAKPNGTGTPIFAAAAGTVTRTIESNVGYGKYIVIDHGNGYNTLYAMNDKLLVSVGDTVEQGQIIAEMGRSGNATGVHLHFEVRYNGRIMNAEDYVTMPEDPGIDSDTLE